MAMSKCGPAPADNVADGSWDVVWTAPSLSSHGFSASYDLHTGPVINTTMLTTGDFASFPS